MTKRSEVMASGDGSGVSDDLSFAIDSEVLSINSRSDGLRRQLFQMSSQRHRFPSDGQEFNALKHQLMDELNDEMDRPDGKNTFISSAMIFNHMSQRQRHQLPAIASYESSLYSLSAQELCRKLGVNCNDSTTDGQHTDLKVVLKPLVGDSAGGEPNHGSDIEMKTITPVKPDQQSSSNSQVNYNCGHNVVTNNILNSVGSLDNSFVDNKPINKSVANTSVFAANGTNYKGLNESPTRVSGLFRTNSPKNSHKSGGDSSVETSDQIAAKRPTFMSGFEKKVVDDVKKGSMDVMTGRQALRQMKNSFKNPMKSDKMPQQDEEPLDPNLKNIEKHLIDVIENEIITTLDPIDWSDVAGLDFAKNKIKEIAVLPLLRPDLFRGLRKPPKGILLFGPPGTGKTFLGRCIASQTKSTFFSITVSALNSKWIGEGEKTIRAMFAVARARQPSVIFIDEIDSLLKTRSDSEHESSRRMKTEFLAQFEGVGTNPDEKLLIIGATNRPQELDDAARRRLSAKLYIRLPDTGARQHIIRNCLKLEQNSLTEEEIQSLGDQTDGYSCADMKDLCRESAMEPMRDSNIMSNINEITAQEIRDIVYDDFLKNLAYVKPSVRKEDLEAYEKWNQEFGINCRQN